MKLCPFLTGKDITESVHCIGGMCALWVDKVERFDYPDRQITLKGEPVDYYEVHTVGCGLNNHLETTVTGGKDAV